MCFEPSGLKPCDWLAYLGRYLYRGVFLEKNIISNRDGKVSFCYRDNNRKRQTRTLAGGDCLWLLLKHVLRRRFRRLRDYGLLHAKAKRLIQPLQMTLHKRVPPPTTPMPPRPPLLCDRCGHVMTSWLEWWCQAATGCAECRH